MFGGKTTINLLDDFKKSFKQPKGLYLIKHKQGYILVSNEGYRYVRNAAKINQL